MKMNRMLRPAVLLLAALLLCGCGSPSAEQPASAASPAGAAETSAPEAEASDTLAWQASFTPVDTEQTDYPSILAYTETGCYAQTSEAIGEQIPEGVTPAYEGEYMQYASRLWFIGYDGSVTKLAAYEPIETPESEEGQYHFTVNIYPECAFAREDGSLCLVENVYENWCTRPDLTWDDDEFWNYSGYANLHYLRILEASGAEQSRALLDLGDAGYCSGFAGRKDGTILLACGNALRIYSPSGELQKEIEMEDYVSQILTAADGTVYTVSWGDTGEAITPIDTEAGTPGEPIALPSTAYQLFSGGGEHPLYYSTGSRLYAFDPATGESQSLFSWMDTDIGSDVYQIYVSSDGAVHGILSQGYEATDTGEYAYRSELFAVRQVPESEIPEKKSVTLAGYGLPYDLLQQIVSYNRSSKDVRIDVKDYSSADYSTSEEAADAKDPGLTRLKTELTTGNVPDLICLNDLDARELNRQGILEDLYSFMDADEETGRENFFSNILSAYESGGRLYAVPLSFQIRTLAGAASVVGDEPGWTYEELENALASMPEGCTALSKETTRGDILGICLALEGKNLIDRDNAACDLGSEAFADLLCFAKSFPSSFDWETYDYMTDADEIRIAAGEQMLQRIYLSSVQDMLYDITVFGEESVTLVGYPTSDASAGSYFSAQSLLGISASSANKAEAWAFLRSLLAEDYQEGLYYLPIRRSAYEAQVKKLMQVNYRKNADGAYLLDENGEKIPEPLFTMIDSQGNRRHVYCLSEDLAAQLTEVVEATTCSGVEEDEVIALVTQEAEAYFAGQKSAEEVGRLAQSKVSIYLSEKS